MHFSWIGLSRISLASAFFLLSACTSGNFAGGNNAKKPEKPADKPTAVEPAKPGPSLGDEATGQDLPNDQPVEPEIEVTPPVEQPPEVVPDTDVVDVTPPQTQPPVTEPPVEQPPVTQPPVEQPPVTQPPITAGPPPTNNEVGNLFVRVVPFVNMEHQIHATDPGTWAILRDSSGRTVGAGPMKLEAACRGNANGNFGYPDVTLNIGLTYVASEVESGAISGSQQGSLSICLVDNPSAHPSEMNCRTGVQGANDPDRPAHWHDKQFSYTIEAGNQIKIQNKAGFANGLYGGNENIQNGLTYAHPTAAGVCGSRAPQYADYNSPLVIDLDQSGSFDLTSPVDNKVSFDVEDSGKPVRTGWVGSKDALLAIDLNGNGAIDSGAELFGEYSTIVAKDVARERFTNFKHGFAALAQYDEDKNGRIDAKDPAFDSMLLWQDKNQNGVSEKSELSRISANAIKAISLAYVSTGSPHSYPMVKHNEIRYESHLVLTNDKKVKIVDVWFAKIREEFALKGDKQ